MTTGSRNYKTEITGPSALWKAKLWKLCLLRNKMQVATNLFIKYGLSWELENYLPNCLYRLEKGSLCILSCRTCVCNHSRKILGQKIVYEGNQKRVPLYQQGSAISESWKWHAPITQKIAKVKATNNEFWRTRNGTWPIAILRLLLGKNTFWK